MVFKNLASIEMTNEHFLNIGGMNVGWLQKVFTSIKGYELVYFEKSASRSGKYNTLPYFGYYPTTALYVVHGCRSLAIGGGSIYDNVWMIDRK